MSGMINSDHGNDKAILIADDDPTSLSMLKGMLRKWGFDPIAVRDGAAAWNVFDGEVAPKLAILDWNMPVSNGVDICQRIRREQPSDPPYIILLTSKDDKADMVAGLEAGADDYVTKPFYPEELRARIEVGERMIALRARLNKALSLLEHQALHDELTGIMNRRAVTGALRREIAKAERGGGALSIGLVDIDFFKKINDEHGHLVGDKVLVGMTGLLRHELRKYDFLGRWGGEEFLIVTPGVGSGSVSGLYERLRGSIAENMIDAGSVKLGVTISIGVAVADADDKENLTLDGLLKRADDALYQAKADGRNKVIVNPAPSFNNARRV